MGRHHSIICHTVPPGRAVPPNRQERGHSPDARGELKFAPRRGPAGSNSNRRLSFPRSLTSRQGDQHDQDWNIGRRRRRRWHLAG